MGSPYGGIDPPTETIQEPPDGGSFNSDNLGLVEIPAECDDSDSGFDSDSGYDSDNSDSSCGDDYNG